MSDLDSIENVQVPSDADGESSFGETWRSARRAITRCEKKSGYQVRNMNCSQYSGRTLFIQYSMDRILRTGSLKELLAFSEKQTTLGNRSAVDNFVLAEKRDSW